MSLVITWGPRMIIIMGGGRYLADSSSNALTILGPMRVMTYNVHQCTGIDRKTSPRRIADLIAHYQPDLVGLQEIDVHRLRTNKEHQARMLAEMLGMHFVFYPAIRDSSEHYGDAIFSRFPITPVRFGTLPMPQRRRQVEPRGALWVEVDYRGRKVQLFNTQIEKLEAAQ